MPKKNLNIVLLIVPTLVLMAWALMLSIELHSGQEVTVRIKGYDPRSLLSGHYISYDIDWEKTDCSQFEKSVCPKEDFELLLNSQTAFYVGLGGKHYRFYISEKDAQFLDREIRKTDNVAEIVYSYRAGKKPYALRLLVNGKSWASGR